MARRISLVLAISAMGLVIPAQASALWNHLGSEMGGETVVFTGTVSTSEWHCNPLESVKHIREWWFDDDTGWVYDSTGTHCTPAGTAKNLGCTKVTEVAPEKLAWKGEVVENKVVKVSGVKLRVGFSGGVLCPKSITYEGSFTETPNNPKSISSMSLSGTLLSSIGTEVSLGGTLEVIGGAAGTYGIG